MISFVLYSVLRIGVWLSLVERFVRDEEVACSNLVTPTNGRRSEDRRPFLFLFHYYRSVPVFAPLSDIRAGHKVVDICCMHIQFKKFLRFFA